MEKEILRRLRTSIILYEEQKATKRDGYEIIND